MATNDLVLTVEDSAARFVPVTDLVAYNSATKTFTFDDGHALVFGSTSGGTIGAASDKLGFFGQTPGTCPVLATGGGATVDNVITALQALGLVKQS